MAIKQNVKYRELGIEIDLERIRMMGNMVLVSIESDLDNHFRESSGGIILDMTSNKEANAISTGYAYKVPERLEYHGYGSHIEKGEIHLEYKTEVEIREGDLVYFNNLSVERAIEDGRVYWSGEQFFVMIRYDRMYMRVREGKYGGLNGWHIGEVVEEDIESKLIYTGFVGKKESKTEVEVKHRGKGLQEIYMAQEWGSDIGFLEEGDIAITKPGFLNKLERGIINVGGNKRLVRFQEKDVIGKWVGTEIASNKQYCIVEKMENSMSKVIETKNAVSKGRVMSYLGEELEVGEIVYYPRSQERVLNLRGRLYTFVMQVHSVSEIGGVKIIMA